MIKGIVKTIALNQCTDIISRTLNLCPKERNRKNRKLAERLEILPGYTTTVSTLFELYSLIEPNQVSKNSVKNQDSGSGEKKFKKWVKLQ